MKFPSHNLKKDDMVIVNDAHWTMTFCEKDRYAAYKYYIPKFLDHFSVENQKLKVFITSPPWNPNIANNNCKRRTNINLSWANQQGSLIAHERLWYVFDAWGLLMPTYNTTCDPAHFSCHRKKGKKNEIYGTGIIVVEALWDFLLEDIFQLSIL